MRHLPALIDRIVAQNRMQRQFFERVLPELRPDEEADLERYVGYCLAAGDTLDELAEAYDLIVKDTLREQIYFKKHGRYRYAKFSDVASSVYMNPDYMGRYMHGLALTAFLWPNHARLRRYFVEQLRGPAVAPGGRYLEVGPGHGFYFMAALRSGLFASCEGVDISPTSVALTQRLIGSGAFGTFRNWQIEMVDFLEASLEGPFELVTMGEVLEHVEDPGRFLRRARACALPSGRVFVTTCINSPALDHIFLFESVEHLRAIVAEAGLRVRGELVLPYTGSTLDESVAQRLPINIAMELVP